VSRPPLRRPPLRRPPLRRPPLRRLSWRRRRAPQPAATPGPSARPASAPPPKVAGLERSFLVGTWGPKVDPRQAEARAQAIVRSGRKRDLGLQFGYAARLRLDADGSGQLGLGVEGELQGGELQWTAKELSADSLLLILRSGETLRSGERLPSGEGELLGRLRVERKGKQIELSGDGKFAGTWIRLARGSSAKLEDQVALVAYARHVGKLASARQLDEDIKRGVARWRSGHEALAQLVRKVCKTGDRLGTAHKDGPVRGAAAKKQRDTLRKMEAALIATDSPYGLESPIPARLAGRTRSFIEEWLTGTWAVDMAALDFERLTDNKTAKQRESIRHALGTQRLRFDLRGLCSDSFEDAPGDRATNIGYYALVEVPPSWCRLVILEEIRGSGGAVVDQRYRHLAAFRQGERLWIRDELGRLIPYQRTPR
jgi:hypothetical protein